LIFEFLLAMSRHLFDSAMRKEKAVAAAQLMVWRNRTTGVAQDSCVIVLTSSLRGCHGSAVQLSAGEGWGFVGKGLRGRALAHGKQK
jgi:hypothetical protein